MEELEFRLDFCEECFQMTNHIDDECQKCKAGKRENKNDIIKEYENYEDEKDS